MLSERGYLVSGHKLAGTTVPAATTGLPRFKGPGTLVYGLKLPTGQPVHFQKFWSVQGPIQQ